MTPRVNRCRLQISPTYLLTVGRVQPRLVEEKLGLVIEEPAVDCASAQVIIACQQEAATGSNRQ